MQPRGSSRRDLLKRLGMGALAAPVLTAASIRGQQPAPQAPEDPARAADRERRMKWWHDARFGMFIHWGAYSAYGRHEWAMENEAIPVAEYEQFARQFKPKPDAPREFARLAKRAGQKYMVMT